MDILLRNQARTDVFDEVFGFVTFMRKILFYWRSFRSFENKQKFAMIFEGGKSGVAFGRTKWAPHRGRTSPPVQGLCQCQKQYRSDGSPSRCRAWLSRHDRSANSGVSRNNRHLLVGACKKCELFQFFRLKINFPLFSVESSKKLHVLYIYLSIWYAYQSTKALKVVDIY